MEPNTHQERKQVEHSHQWDETEIELPYDLLLVG